MTGALAVLVHLTQQGVSVQWRDGKAVFNAPPASLDDVIALIDARRDEISAFLHPEAVQRRLDAEAGVLQAPCPSDIDGDRWETVLAGLRAFIARGYAEEALRLGWSRDELFAVPPLWVRGDLCGVGLAIGDRELVSITAGRIAIKTTSGAELAFYRKPSVDYRLVFETHLKLTRGNYPGDSDEPRLRATEHTVNIYRANTGADLETAKAAVLAVIKPSGPEETS